MTSTTSSSPTEGQTIRGRTEEIVQALRASDDEGEQRRLRDELAVVNLPVARSIAQRYSGRGLATEDLFQVAALAMVQSARRFDPGAGHPFMSYCVPTVRGEVRRHFRDRGWVVRPPRRLQELQQHVRAAESSLSDALGRPATDLELARTLHVSEADVREAKDGRGCFAPASLDKPLSEEVSMTLGDLLVAEDDESPAMEARIVLDTALRRLPQRDARIVRLRFVTGMTQREIAEDIGVTQMQVSRLLARILRELRGTLGGLEHPPDVA